MAACVPSGAVAVAGIDLEELRKAGGDRSLPAVWLALLEPFRGARRVLAAYDGKELLIVAAGSFAQPPSGGVLLSPRLALAGSSSMIQAATAQHASGRGGAPDLLDHAARFTERPLWAVIRGGTHLPFTGNAANLNRLLQLISYAVVGATFGSEMRLDIDGLCPSPERARELEETLRAAMTLARTAGRRGPAASLLESVQIRRDNSDVHVSLRGDASSLEELWR